MSYDAKELYQNLVDYQRRRHNLGGGYGWPGKPVHSEASTQYPNILAEMLASGKWLGAMAQFAGVSPEIMAAVIEDEEDLTHIEFLRLANRWRKCNLDYLCSSVLQIVDPATNKGKRRRRELHDLLEKAAALPDPEMDALEMTTDWIRSASAVYNLLADGALITYADYWWACDRVNKALAISKPKTVRTKRIIPA